MGINNLKNKQLTFFKYLKANPGFGGSLLKAANARSPRPISSRQAIHIVLKSEIAKGTRSLRHRDHRQRVDDIVFLQAEKWGIRFYKYANAGNHLHILARPHSRRRFIGFLRSISGLIARQVLAAERGRAQRVKFWQYRPFTRLVEWGRDFVRAKEYIGLNAKEALGFLSERKLKKLALSLVDLASTG